MDDVIVLGSNKKEQDKRLTATLTLLEDVHVGVILNPTKCEFRKSTIKFLGHACD